MTRKVAYDPLKKEKEGCKWVIQNKFDFLLIQNSVTAFITYYMPLPKSWSEKKKNKMLNQPHVSRPDIDNLLKFTFDCMNGIVFKDDSQIYHLASEKIYSHNPRTEICLLWDN